MKRIAGFFWREKMLTLSLLAAAGSLLSVLLLALFGLTMGLKMPNLTWTNELAPIKQSMNIMIALFGGWFYALALGGLFLWRGWRIGANAYLIIALAVTAAASAALWVWLKKKGTKIYETL